MSLREADAHDRVLLDLHDYLLNLTGAKVQLDLLHSKHAHWDQYTLEYDFAKITAFRLADKVHLHVCFIKDPNRRAFIWEGKQVDETLKRQMSKAQPNRMIQEVLSVGRTGDLNQDLDVAFLPF